MTSAVIPLPALRVLQAKAVQKATMMAKAKTADVRRAADCGRMVDPYAKAIKQVERDAAMIGLDINTREE
jgi:hypothetical protein